MTAKIRVTRSSIPRRCKATYAVPIAKCNKPVKKKYSFGNTYFNQPLPRAERSSIPINERYFQHANKYGLACNNVVKVVGTHFTGPGKQGDFEWMLQNDLKEQFVFMINDNKECHELQQPNHPDKESLHHGGGNASVRTYKHFKAGHITSCRTDLFHGLHGEEEYIEYVEPENLVPVAGGYNAQSDWKTLNRTSNGGWHTAFKYIHETSGEVVAYIKHIIDAKTMVDLAMERIVKHFVNDRTKTTLFFAYDPNTDLLGLGIFKYRLARTIPLFATSPRDFVRYRR